MALLAPCGASLTLVMASIIVAVAEVSTLVPVRPLNGPTVPAPPPSWTWNWKLALPLKFALGVNTTLPAVMSAAGIVAPLANGLLLTAVLTRLPPTGVETSLTFRKALAGVSLRSAKPKSVVVKV